MLKPLYDDVIIVLSAPPLSPLQSKPVEEDSVVQPIARSRNRVSGQ